MDRTWKVAARGIVAAAIAVSTLLATGTTVALASPGAILVARLRVNPSSGPAGSMVVVQGRSFLPDALVRLSFTDAHGTIDLGVAQTNSGGAFKELYCIPGYASVGKDLISAEQQLEHGSVWGQTAFMVTGLPTAVGRRTAAKGSIATPLSTCV